MPEPLNYLPPLFVGRFSYRSRRGAFFFTTLSMFGLVWYTVLSQASFSQPHAKFICSLLYLPFGLIAVGFGVAIFLDLRQTNFVIEPGGVRVRRKLIPWEKIKRFGASVHSTPFWKSLQLFYCTQAYPKGFHLLDSDPLSHEEYQRLIDRLRTCIGHHEGLEVGGYEDFVGEGGAPS